METGAWWSRSGFGSFVSTGTSRFRGIPLCGSIAPRRAADNRDGIL